MQLCILKKCDAKIAFKLLLAPSITAEKNFTTRHHSMIFSWLSLLQNPNFIPKQILWHYSQHTEVSIVQVPS